MHTDLWTHLKEFLARRQPKRLAVIERLESDSVATTPSPPFVMRGVLRGVDRWDDYDAIGWTIHISDGRPGEVIRWPGGAGRVP